MSCWTPTNEGNVGSNGTKRNGFHLYLWRIFLQWIPRTCAVRPVSTWWRTVHAPMALTVTFAARLREVDWTLFSCNQHLHLMKRSTLHNCSPKNLHFVHGTYQESLFWSICSIAISDFSGAFRNKKEVESGKSRVYCEVTLCILRRRSWTRYSDSSCSMQPPVFWPQLTGGRTSIGTPQVISLSMPICCMYGIFTYIWLKICATRWWFSTMLHFRKYLWKIPILTNKRLNGLKP